MSLLETTAGLQDQIFDAIKVGQESLLSAVSTVADNVAPIADKLPSAPFADRLPNPAQVVDSYYGFAQKLLANQQDFAVKLVEAYRPAKAATPPTAKASAKRA